MLWLEQCHPPHFSAFGEGPIQSLVESFDCAICWIIIYNAATAQYRYMDDVEPFPFHFFSVVKILQWLWRMVDKEKPFPLEYCLLVFLVRRALRFKNSL